MPHLKARLASKTPHGSSVSQVATMPAGLLAQTARRLRVWAILYAFVFFMAGILPAILVEGLRAEFLASALQWAPPVCSILMAIAIAAIVSRPSLSGSAVVRIGLLFQVAGAYGIAAAEYLDPPATYVVSPVAGLSWVAVWVLSFTVTVPSPPSWALAAALASVSAVPIVTSVAISIGTSPPIEPVLFFLRVVLPYLLVVLVAWMGARLVYRLGADLERALDLGSYRLVDRLGYGGMGEVWRAQHRFLARPAAVKLIRPEIMDAAGGARQSELRVRFEREAQTIALLQSPHTIGLFDYGIADDGSFYYVMELLDGFDLKSLVEKFGPIPVERAVHLLRQVCHSLAEAHASGIVHRDITPANVFVCRYGRDVDFVKVLDFGLAKPQAQAVAGDGGTTRVGGVGGTPAFMSPEQALGERTLDGRSDLYAVGCLAYWLVTGQIPFSKASSMATLIAHTQELPAPPSQRTELRVPFSFDALVLWCLAKTPEERPASAEALARELDALDDVGEWSPTQARAWWDLHRPREAPQVGEHAGRASRRADTRQ